MEINYPFDYSRWWGDLIIKNWQHRNANLVLLNLFLRLSGIPRRGRQVMVMTASSLPLLQYASEPNER